MRWAMCLILGLAMGAATATPSRAAEDLFEALADKTVDYPAPGGGREAMQVFHRDGTTTYTTDQSSAGRWQVRGAQYCSNWPPGFTWDCYDVVLTPSAGTIIFVDTRGNETKGIFRE